jgi:hypothetical protein
MGFSSFRWSCSSLLRTKGIIHQVVASFSLSCRLEESERIEMMNNLKLKWAATNAQYQALSFCLDTISKIKKKERFLTYHLLSLLCDQILTKRLIIITDLLHRLNLTKTAPPKRRKFIDIELCL